MREADKAQTWQQMHDGLHIGGAEGMDDYLKVRVCIYCNSSCQEKFNNGNGAWVCTVCRRMQ